MTERKRRANLRAVNGDRPAIEVPEKAVRRKFSLNYKRRTLREVEAAQPGTLAAILRREGLYSSHIQKWRAQEETRQLEAKRGRKKNPLTAKTRN